MLLSKKLNSLGYLKKIKSCIVTTLFISECSIPKGISFDKPWYISKLSL